MEYWKKFKTKLKKEKKERRRRMVEVKSNSKETGLGSENNGRGAVEKMTLRAKFVIYKWNGSGYRTKPCTRT